MGGHKTTIIENEKECTGQHTSKFKWERKYKAVRLMEQYNESKNSITIQKGNENDSE